MYKQLLIDTLPQFRGLSLEQLADKSGIELSRIESILEQDGEDDVSQKEYVAIAVALPTSINDCVRELADEIAELEYLERQLSIIETGASDADSPLFAGMRRLLRRVIRSL